MIRSAAQSTTRMGHTVPPPPPPPHGALAAGSSPPTEADGSSPYTGDSAPLSRLATLSLRTITPPPGPAAWQPGAGELLPIPCSIVRHKPTIRAASSMKTAHVSTEAPSTPIQHSYGCHRAEAPS